MVVEQVVDPGVKGLGGHAVNPVSAVTAVPGPVGHGDRHHVYVAVLGP